MLKNKIVISIAKYAKAIRLNNNCELKPLCFTCNNIFLMAQLYADKHNHLDIAHLSACKMIRIIPETIVAGDQFNNMMNSLKSYGKEQGYTVIEAAGLIEPELVQRFVENDFKITFATSSCATPICRFKL